MFVNKLKMDAIAEAVKKCMDEADLEETGLRKAAYAAHTKGEKMFSFKGKTYPVKVQGEEVSYGEEMKEESCEDEVKKHEKRLHGKDGEVSKHVSKMHKEEIEELDEKNVPTSPEKWAQAKAQAKAKFDVYPSAYANGWASKKYKSMGGGWKSVSEESEQIEEKELSDKQKKIAKLNHPKDKIDAGDLAKLRGEEVELDEADKVTTPTGMKVYGSSYGDSAKARRDQLKRPVDDAKGPRKSELAQMAKVKKEEFFKDRLITNYIEEEALFEAELQEVLSKDATAGEWISDFVHSDNPKFEGKSKKMRQKMALAAYYAKQRNESVQDSYPVTTDTLAGRMPGGMSNSFKQFKLRVRPTDKESEDETNLIPALRTAPLGAREPHIGRGGLIAVPPAGVVRKEEVELDEAVMTHIALGKKVKNSEGGYDQTVHHKGEHIGNVHSYAHLDYETGKKTGRTKYATSDKHGGLMTVGHITPDEGVDELRWVHAQNKKTQKEEVEHLDEDNLGDIAQKHGMKLNRTAYGANMTHPKHGDVSVNRYGEWKHKGASGDSSNQFSSLNKHLSSLKEEVEHLNEDGFAQAKKQGWSVSQHYHHTKITHPKHGIISVDRYGEWMHHPDQDWVGRPKGNLIAHGQDHDLNKHLSSLKEEVELDEDGASNIKKDITASRLELKMKNRDVADKSYLKDRPGSVKSDIKNFGRFLAGKKETNEGKQPETDNVPFIPFEGPYTKSPETVKDKSGAVHTPMSRAKDLAKAAMKRVKTEMLGKAPGNNG